MGRLMKKEIKLAMHPTMPLFLALSALLIVPNYPYYVTFFYTTLAVFFTCLLGRENRDVFYTLLLPVRKTDVVKVRFALVIGAELLQMLLAVPFAFLRQRINVGPNAVGMEANIAFFGFSFVMLGIFHLVFFSIYYRDVNKVGKAFVSSSVICFLYMLVAETLVHAVPFLRDKIDTYDTVYVKEKLVILGVGAVVYMLCTCAAYKRSVKLFEAQDL